MNVFAVDMTASTCWIDDEQGWRFRASDGRVVAEVRTVDLPGDQDDDETTRVCIQMGALVEAALPAVSLPVGAGGVPEAVHEDACHDREGEPGGDDPVGVPPCAAGHVGEAT